MNISEVLAGVPLLSALPPSLAQTPVLGLDYDSRRVKEGYLFFAFPGARVDGRQFARQAIENGAIAIVSELAAPEDVAAPVSGAAWIQVEHGRRALALAAKTFYGRLDEKIPVMPTSGIFSSSLP